MSETDAVLTDLSANPGTERQPKGMEPGMVQLLETKPLRLADAAILRRMGVFSGSLKTIEAAIRRLLALNERGCYLVNGWLLPKPPTMIRSDAAAVPSPAAPEAEAPAAPAEPEAAALATPEPADPAASEPVASAASEPVAVTGFIAILPDAFRPEIGRLTIRATNPAFLPDLLRLACRTAFGEQPFLRLESLVPAFPETVLHAFKDFGFHTDTIVPAALFRAPAPADHYQLSLAKTQNRHPGVGVVAYRLGVLSVTGTDETIDAVEFHRTGEPVRNPYLRDVFAIWGLLDDRDRLRPADAWIRQVRNAKLPVMVACAVHQLDEYLAGNRQAFDLTLSLSVGSAFQQSVWTALQTIPYGTTETYLDIALRIAGGDLKKARAMSRAVGSACGANPVPVLVPCHRVIGRNGRLIGFSGGIENKEFLLEHELFRRRANG